jgi:chemotaxis signal transduction protein
MNRISAVAVIAMVAFLLAGVVGCNRVTRENYNKVQAGMTVQQVKDILGNPDETKSAGASVLGISADKTTMIWKSGDKSITVTFVNEQVLTTSMQNLE